MLSLVFDGRVTIVWRRAGRCSPEFYRLSQYCVPCPEKSNAALLVLQAAVCCLLVFIGYWFERYSARMASFLALALHVQYLSVLSYAELFSAPTFGADMSMTNLGHWPTAPRAMFQWLGTYVAPFLFFPACVRARGVRTGSVNAAGQVCRWIDELSREPRRSDSAGAAGL